MDFGEHNFKLNSSDKSGTTEREHLEQVERQTGRKLEALVGPEFPMLLSHVWTAFIALSNNRTTGFSGPNPISYEQIKAWKELTETPLSPREVQALVRLDGVYMRVTNNG